VWTIREEGPGDFAAIRAVHLDAFSTPAEAGLVDALRAAGALSLSLVAEVGGRVVGHIAFSPVTVDGPEGSWRGLGLAPMAVVSACQRKGIGSALVREGLARLENAGEAFAVVLGHSHYYPRFGFVPASRHGLRWDRPVPDEAFLVRELRPWGLDGVRGVVRYRPEFEAV
jgi:putative acetyltransferase